jgi:CRISPR-associated protein Cas5h
MKAISFELSGKTACFRKPDVNQFTYFTYNNIHKPVLLGLLGAILGLKGHIQLSNENRQIEEENKAIKKKADKKPLNDGFPEFYEKLKDLKISITPLAPHGYFSKKIQVFNNSVGYASKEMGGNLIVREQWLEEPKWQIMILNDGSKEYEILNEYLLKGKAVYVPYLGKNDHPATINKVKEIELNTSIDGSKISSLFIENEFEISKMPPRGELSYFFKEVSPMRLQKEHHFYEYENLIFTNHRVAQNGSKNLFSFEEKNYFFL